MANMRFINKSRKPLITDGISNELWLDYLLAEKPIPDKLQSIVPPMPDEKIQLHFTGATGRISLLQALDFYIIANSYISSHMLRGKISEQRLLDFGCGWARITRMWLRSISPDRIVGVDPMEEMIALCRQMLPKVTFFQINPAPPITELSSNSFELLTAYSVFSHLNESYLCLWFDEFARILVPGALLFVTTRSRSFIDHVVEMRKRGEYASYATGLREVFVDADSAYNAYDEGKVIHQPIGGGTLSTSFYGETCVPPIYFQRFSNNFSVIGSVPEMKYESNQTLIILERK